jgi:hypothetical protein
MNTCVLLTAARYIVVAEPIDKGIAMTDGIFLVNDREMISGAVSGVLGHAMGGLERLFLADKSIMFTSAIEAEHAQDPIATIRVRHEITTPFWHCVLGRIV